MIESDRSPVITSRRLTLRRFDLGDAAQLVALDADERVRRYIIDDPVETLAQALTLIDYLQGVYPTGLGIWHASDDTGAFIGHFSLMPIDDADVAIGVRLHPEAWGKFYALEGGRALCRYAFGTQGLERIVGYCNPENRVVDLLLRRLRFRNEGPVERDGRTVTRYVRPRDP
ncbi:MAG: GNAT family N-acetyltransferase [Pseudomonadota bacterium]